MNNYVMCVNSGKIYNTAQDAADDTGVSKSGISLVLSGKRAGCNGYIYLRAGGSEQRRLSADQGGSVGGSSEDHQPERLPHRAAGSVRRRRCRRSVFVRR